MTTSEIKKLAANFKREYELHEVTEQALIEAFQKQGFTVIEFNPVFNDEDVTTVIDNLGLREITSHSNGFIYVDGNYRLVFLNDRLNTEERCYVLAHEEGHYYCGHAFSKSIAGKSVAEEREANEFSHYLFRESVKKRVANTVSKHKKSLIALAVIAGLIAGSCVATKEYHDRKLYAGEYYVTMHGEKYHLKSCVTIQGHEIRRLTREDVEAGKYEPCSVCQPNK